MNRLASHGDHFLFYHFCLLSVLFYINLWHNFSFCLSWTKLTLHVHYYLWELIFLSFLFFIPFFVNPFDEMAPLDKDVAWQKKKKSKRQIHNPSPQTGRHVERRTINQRAKALTGNINSDMHRMWTIILWRAVAHTVVLTRGLSTAWLGRRASLQTGQPGYVQAW